MVHLLAPKKLRRAEIPVEHSSGTRLSGWPLPPGRFPAPASAARCGSASPGGRPVAKRREKKETN